MKDWLLLEPLLMLELELPGPVLLALELGVVEEAALEFEALPLARTSWPTWLAICESGPVRL